MSVLCSCRPAHVWDTATMMAPPRRKCLPGAKVTRPAKVFELETSWAKLYSSFPPHHPSATVAQAAACEALWRWEHPYLDTAANSHRLLRDRAGDRAGLLGPSPRSGMERMKQGWAGRQAPGQNL